MHYVLIIGLLVKVYKNPKLRISIDQKLIDEIRFNNDIKQQTVDFTKDLFFDPVAESHRSTEIMPTKFFVYGIEKDVLQEGSTLSLEFFDWQSNYNNGFMNVSDTYKLHSVFLAPSQFYFNNKSTFGKFKKEILADEFIHDESGNFPKEKNKAHKWQGWPCPDILSNTSEDFEAYFNHTKGENCKVDIKIIEKGGIYQFNTDFHDDSSKLWIEQVSRWSKTVDDAYKNKKKIWPINNKFLSFCYHFRNNKYLHEDQRSYS